MRRRELMGGAVGLLAAPALVRAASATTLKFVPYADLALLDPAVSAFVTRNHVMMVYDTLFALDEAGVPQPQMLAGSTVEPDGLTWTLTLRDGLLFHDNTPVRGRDVVASVRRWGTLDAFGQALLAATDDLSAPTDTTVRFRLKRRFDLLPVALAHPTNTVAAIMPERPRGDAGDSPADGDRRQWPVPLRDGRTGPRVAQRVCQVRPLRPALARHAEFLRRAAGGLFRPRGMGHDPRPGNSGGSPAVRRGRLGGAAADGPGAELADDPRHRRRRGGNIRLAGVSCGSTSCSRPSTMQRSGGSC